MHFSDRLKTYFTRKNLRIGASAIWKLVLILLLELAVLLLFWNLFTGVLHLFPTTVKFTLVQDILKTIIQVDGILLGFAGLLYAQLLWGLNSQQNLFHENFLKASTTLEKDRMRKDMTAIQDKRRSLIVALTFIVLMYVGSIFVSLASLANTQIASGEDVLLSEGYLAGPILWMFLGIISTSAYAGVVSFLPREVEDEESGKPSNELDKKHLGQSEQPEAN